MRASDRNYLSIVSLLLDNGASVNQAMLDGRTALIMACMKDHLLLAQLLVSRGAVVDRNHLLLVGYVPVIRFMLDSGADVNGQSAEGNSPLMDATIKGHTEAVDLRLRRGAVVDLPNKNHNTALHVACHYEKEGAVRLLLAAGASTTLEDKQGHCAMDWATEPRHAAVRQILQKHMHADGQ